MTPSSRHLVTGALLLGLVLVIVVMLRPGAVPVDAAVVARHALQVIIREEGITRVSDRYTVATPVAGHLARSTLRAGDSVSRGVVVARVSPLPLDPRARSEASARLESLRDAHRVAQAAVVAARASLDDAIRVHQRAESLATRGMLSAEAREQATLAEITMARGLESAQFRAQAAQHEVEAARAGLHPGEALILRAPVDGQVLRVHEESARALPAGAPILELGNPARLEVRAHLLSSDAVRVTPGDTMLVEAWGGDTTLRAVVRRVEPSGFTKVSALGVEEQRVHVLADFVDRPDRLGDQYRVEVKVILWSGQDVLQAPSSAFFRRGSEWLAFVIRRGRAREQAVTLGHRGEFAVQVVSGLTEGDLVIRHPTERITEGDRVEARRR